MSMWTNNSPSAMLRRINPGHRKAIAAATIAPVSVSLTLLLLEIVVRLAGSTDEYGRFTILHFTLEPQALQVEQLRGEVEGYLANKDIAVVIYDDALGWSYRPNSTRQANTFAINSAGFRSRRDFSKSPPADTLRIALFGNSFTAGDDVSDEEVWGYLLEQKLKEAGIRAEVLNFGVGAYGMDQAYLRWREQGKYFEPDIVIFGLQPENLKRNVNVFRQLLHPSGPAFSKPRFVLIDDELQLLNSPTIPPEQLMEVFENFSDHPLAAYEFHYQSRSRAARWWSASRFLSIAFEALRNADEEPEIYTPGSEGGELGRAIIDAFADDMRDQGSEFVVLHLPLHYHLASYFSSSPPRRPPYDFLLEHARETYHYISFEEHLEPSHTEDTHWSPTKHYGPSLHLLLATVVADDLVACIVDGSCALTRFDNLSPIMIAIPASEK